VHSIGSTRQLAPGPALSLLFINFCKKSLALQTRMRQFNTFFSFFFFFFLDVILFPLNGTIDCQLISFDFAIDFAFLKNG